MTSSGISPFSVPSVDQSGNNNGSHNGDVNMRSNIHKTKPKSRRVTKNVSKKIKSSQHKKRKCLHPLCDKMDFLRGMKEMTQFLCHIYSSLSREYYYKFYPEYTSHPEARDDMAHRLFSSLSALDVICRLVSRSYYEDIDTKIKYSVGGKDFPTPTPKLDNFQKIPTCLFSYGLTKKSRGQITKKSGKAASLKNVRVAGRNLHRNEQFYKAIHEIDQTFGSLSI